MKEPLPDQARVKAAFASSDPFVISKHTGMSVSQVTYEVHYTGLLEMKELDAQG